MFNSEENYNYVGRIPDREYFDLTFSIYNADNRLKFEEWYNERSKTEWNFKEELTKYCRDDVLILAQIMKQFHDVCMNMFKLSPWFSPTAPGFVHKVILSRLSTDTNLELPSRSEEDEFNNRIDVLAEKEHWAALTAGEYYFARKALRGGRTDARRLLYELTPEDVSMGREIRYVDMVSMYPFVQVAYDYPVGTPIVKVYDDKYYPCNFHRHPQKGSVMQFNCTCSIDVKRLNHDKMINIIEEDEFTENVEADKFFGLICVSMKPPHNLFHPVIVHWDWNREKCVSSLEPVVEEVITSVEFQEALKAGYEIVKIHRYDQYHRREGLWNEFVKLLYLEKMANSGPANDEARDLIPIYEDRFGMGEAIENSLPRWGYNPAARQVYKIMLNSIWGKHCIRKNLGETYMFNGEGSDDFMNMLENSINDNIKIKCLRVYGDQMQIKTENTKNVEINTHTEYLPTGVFVPAYGRLELYKHLKYLNKRVLYHDTDSIIYIYDPNLQNIPQGDVWGDWSEEKISRGGRISKFISLGPKSYGLKTKDGEELIKLKGLSLKHAHRHMVNFDVLENLIRNRLSIKVPQMQFRYTEGSAIETIHNVKNLEFKPENLKGILKDYTLYPFGYCFCSSNTNICLL